MSVLNDKTLLKTFAWVDELNHELDMLQKSDKAWQTTQVAAEVLQELTVQQSVAAGRRRQGRPRSRRSALRASSARSLATAARSSTRS